MPKKTIKPDTVAEAYFALLADRGVDYFFGNAGTDFASIIEALSKGQMGEVETPIPVTVPHENVAVSMAQGYYLVTGRPQVVMLHVSVGTANGICGIMNASRERVPMLFTAGRTPINEEDVPGGRNIYIHWGQEMYDQAGMLREFVKWDYELRNAVQLETVVDRALSMSMTEPRGPVYLTLPREVLAEEPGTFSFESPSRVRPAAPPAPDAAAISQAARWIADAKMPMIITSSYGKCADDVAVLETFANDHAIPVISYRSRYLALPADHPMHMGFDLVGSFAEADVVIVLESDVPWIPSNHKLNPNAKVIHIGIDPHFARYPIRGFQCDLAIVSDAAAAIRALTETLEGMSGVNAGPEKQRRAKVSEIQEQAQAARQAAVESAASASTIELPWVAHCLGEVMGEDDILVNESQLPIAFLGVRKAGTYFGNSPAGGLGWCCGAALGIKLGARDRRVFSVVGDGGYMFGNPTPTHFVGASMDLPVCTLILNNRMWGSVRKATLGMHPNGAAARLNRAPLTAIEPSPSYERIVEASGGYGECVTAPDELPAALERALKAIDVEKRQAVLNIVMAYDDAQALADIRR